MQPWKPDDSPRQARRIGKTIEELGELIEVLTPYSLRTTPKVSDIEDEVADTVTQCWLTAEVLGVDRDELEGLMHAGLIRKWSATSVEEAKRVTRKAAGLVKILARISIQGLHARNPKTDCCNITTLTLGMADFLAEIHHLSNVLQLSLVRMEARKDVKSRVMAAWEAHFED